MAETDRPKKTGTIIILGVLILILLGSLFLFRDQLSSLFGLAPSGNEELAWEKKITSLKDEIASKQGRGEGVPSPAPTAGISITPVPEPAEEPHEPASESQLLGEQLLAFFHHLDEQDYFLAYQLHEDSETHFKKDLNKLFANPPIVVREADDLFNIMNNMAHFFRVLGKNEISLIKEILMQENEDLERVFALFYRWSEIEDQHEGQQPDIRLPLDNLYEYAGFFLNTLGGQAYLFRRDSQTRMLVKYYAILIVDRENARKANRYGIDIRFPVDSLIEEMTATRKLHNSQQYLNTLLALQSRYQSTNQ